METITDTQLDPQTEFELKHNDIPIFRKEFIGNDSEIVNVQFNTIEIPNHYFETGELLEYSYAWNRNNSSNWNCHNQCSWNR